MNIALWPTLIFMQAGAYLGPPSGNMTITVPSPV